MTRINPITRFSDQLLINALGEEPRILNSVLQRIEKGILFDDIPEHFTLGTGHNKFFFNKCKWIYSHYIDLRAEYYNRFGKDYSKDHLQEVTERYDKIFDSKPFLCNMWYPTSKDENIVLNRILERSKHYKRPHTYYGEEIKDWNKFLFD